MTDHHHWTVALKKKGHAWRCGLVALGLDSMRYEGTRGMIDSSGRGGLRISLVSDEGDPAGLGGLLLLDILILTCFLAV